METYRFGVEAEAIATTKLTVAARLTARAEEFNLSVQKIYYIRENDGTASHEMRRFAGWPGTLILQIR